MLKIITLNVGPLGTNCYILAKDGGAVVIDPGGDANKIIAAIEKNNLSIEYILNTHGHYDHTLANKELSEYANKSVFIHPDDEYLTVADQAFFPTDSGEGDYRTQQLADNQKIEFQDEVISVFHTPGHTKGSVSFLVCGNLFSGDLLFKQSIGRTDLEGGSPRDMVKSLKKVIKLDKKTVVYPGHGPATTIEYELQNNSFIIELKDE